MLRISSVWLLFFFNIGLSGSAFSTYSFRKLVFRLFLFDMFFVCSEL